MAFPSANAGADIANYRRSTWKPLHAEPLDQLLDVGWHRVKVSDATTPQGAAQYFQYTSADPNAAYLSQNIFVQQVMHPDPRFLGSPEPVSAGGGSTTGGPGERVLIAACDPCVF